MLPSCSVSFCLSELPHDPLTTRLLWPNTLDISALLCPATTLKSDLFCSDWRQHPPGGIKLLSKIAFVKPQQYYLLKASDKQALIHQGRWVFTYMLWTGHELGYLVSQVWKAAGVFHLSLPWNLWVALTDWVPRPASFIERNYRELQTKFEENKRIFSGIPHQATNICREIHGLLRRRT